MMPVLDYVLDGDGAWPDLAAKAAAGRVIEAMGERARISLAALPGGTVGGHASVTIRIDLEDGRAVLCETTLRLLYGAVRAIVLRHGEPWMQPGPPAPTEATDG
jgi:hypothetical protein